MAGRGFAAAVCLAALFLGASGCGGSAPSKPPHASPQSARTSTKTSPAAGGTSPTATRKPSGRTSNSTTSGEVSKVLVVMEENHSYAEMKQGMPYLAHLADTYGYATHWTALAHPSLPNYLGIASGSTFGIRDDAPPAAHTSDIGSAGSVFDQAIAAGRTAGTYAETMPDNCHLSDFSDPSVGRPQYAVRHNPWVYFAKGRTNCSAHDKGLGTFAGDAAHDQLPNVGFLIPNLDHDAHNGSLAAADAWLRQQLSPVLQSSDFRRGRLVVVVTADEDDKHSGNMVFTAVLSPRLHHAVVTTDLNHYSLTRYIDEVLGVAPLQNAATAPDLKAAFGL